MNSIHVYSPLHVYVLPALTRALLSPSSLTALRTTRQESLSRYSSLCSAHRKAPKPFPTTGLLHILFLCMGCSSLHWSPGWHLLGLGIDILLGGPSQPLYLDRCPCTLYCPIVQFNPVGFFHSTLKICKHLCICPTIPC